MAGEASEATAGDVQSRAVGGQVCVVRDPGCLVWVLIAGIQDGLVDSGRPGWIWRVPGRRKFGDDLPGGGQFREARFGLGEGGDEVFDLVAQFAGPGGALVMAGLEVFDEFGDVHAAAWRVSCQAGAGVVRRRAVRDGGPVDA